VKNHEEIKGRLTYLLACKSKKIGVKRLKEGYLEKRYLQIWLLKQHHLWSIIKKVRNVCSKCAVINFP